MRSIFRVSRMLFLLLGRIPPLAIIPLPSLSFFPHFFFSFSGECRVEEKSLDLRRSAAARSIKRAEGRYRERGRFSRGGTGVASS